MISHNFHKLLEFVPFNLTECIFVFRTVIDFLFSKLWNFPLFFGGKIQSLLNKKSMTVLKTKIHSVRLNKTDSSGSLFLGHDKKESSVNGILAFIPPVVIYSFSFSYAQGLGRNIYFLSFLLHMGCDAKRDWRGGEGPRGWNSPF